jgi:hypothetical protein
MNFVGPIPKINHYVYANIPNSENKTNRNLLKPQILVPSVSENRCSTCTTTGQKICPVLYKYIQSIRHRKWKTKIKGFECV